MTHAMSDAAENKNLSSTERSRKFMNVTVYFLDDSSHVFQLQAKNLGQVLFDKVCKFINVLEVDYFGLEFEDDKKTKCWLDALKPLCAQISTSFPTMHFCVKFYTPDPVQLEDEFTRYLFGLQVKKDLANGFMQCNDNTAAVMVSYIVQADFGDFTPEKCEDGSYLSAFKFVPLQDAELERKVMENHKRLLGQTPAEADLNLLETARRCELYGIKMTAAKDHEGVPLNLAVAHLGVLVFQNYTKINTFSWAKIRKLSFKRRKFLIKLHPEGYGYYKDTVEFFFDGRNECKNFWKKCIENHTFFRCTDAKHGMRQRPKIFSRGSSFRYSGRTQKQVSEYVRENGIKRAPFQRSTSLRSPSSPSRSMGSSVSPQPLLPLASLSCGSISDAGKDNPKQADAPMNGQATPAVTPGEDSRDDITYDNISHDSYDILERESQQDANCMPPTNNTRPNSFEDHPDGPTNKQGTRTNSTEDHHPPTNSGDQTNSSGGHIPTNPSEDHPPTNCMPTNTPDEVKSIAEDHKDLEKLENNNNNTPMQTTEEKIINDIKELNAANDSRRGLDRMEHFVDDDGNRLSGEARFEESSVSSANMSSNDYENGSVLHDSQQNFGTSTFYISSPYAVRLANKRKSLTDKTYCLAKELLMTERTYRKDLEIVNVVFREEFYKQKTVESSAVDRILSLVDPLYERHCSLLRDLEQRLAFWEGRPSSRNSSGTRGVADILLLHKLMTEIHTHYLENLSSALELLYFELSENPEFAAVYRHFESQKVCYLPLTSFLLRATFRLPYYAALLKDLLSCSNTQHENYNACVDMLAELKSSCENFDGRILPLVNFVKLMELQRSLIGFPNLVDKKREFIREGTLFKLTKNGSQQHMFFLFSDTLLWATRVHGGQLSFRVRGHLLSSELRVGSADPIHGQGHCLSLWTPDRTPLLVGAPSDRERALWERDLTMEPSAIKVESQNGGGHPEDNEEEEEYEEVEVIVEEEKVTHVNTSMHICWHRNISVSCQDLLLSMKHSMSGYLLRKFRNSSGWQKVWVVLANLCLFFYRSYLEESPLASLPLAGYRITRTSSSDLVHGDLVFKLVFKNHEYFFTVENKHTFDRWMEAVGICTLTQEENTRL